jgi:two-component sensor histidine kinase
VARRCSEAAALSLTMNAPRKQSSTEFGGASDGALRRDYERLHAENERLHGNLDRQAHELAELKAQFGRYETALSGSKVTVFTQDRELRYTSISNGLRGLTAAQILGLTDEQLFSARAGAAMSALKRDVMQSGEQRHGEIELDDAHCHFDLHIEPVRNTAGEIAGVAGVLVDITRRKEDEAHLRLLLRELTHRSKNLLAVIQAMARQTARHAGSIEGFLRQFAGRLQSLAAAHDLLVRESWHGASVEELVRAQLAAFFDRESGRIELKGPVIVLKPEAAQNLGLALHELAGNAARFGALSVAEGKVAIHWTRVHGSDGDSLVLEWHEQFGPAVKARRKKGFGSMVLERNLGHALDAEVKLDFDKQGLRCRIVIPAVHLLLRT